MDQGILPSEVAQKDYSALHKVREKFSLSENIGDEREVLTERNTGGETEVLTERERAQEMR